MESRAQCYIHQHGDHRLQAKVKVEKLVAEHCFEHLQHQVVKLDITGHWLRGLVHQGLALRLDKFDQVWQ